MPMCGFNQDMLEGLNSFNKGLVEHGIIYRSEKKKQSQETTIDCELSDMKRFLSEVDGIKDVHLRELTRSLTAYASAFYSLLKKEGVENYPKIIRFLNMFFYEMDKKYYSELEGDLEDMKKLAIYLNSIGEKNATKRI